jgi:hypothetical protein
MNRRGFLGFFGAALAAPAIIRTAGLLMPIKPALVLPDLPPLAPVTGLVLRNGVWVSVPMLLQTAAEQLLIPPAVVEGEMVRSMRYRSPSMAEYLAGAVPATSFRRSS